MIRIVVDSAADLTARDRSLPGVIVVPLNVTFEDDTVLSDDGTMSKEEFFEKLAACNKLPRTSQPSPQTYIDIFEQAAEAGDEVIVITLAQKLSGTWQCANLAAAEVGGAIYIVDSGTATQGEGYLVREAVRLRDEGSSAADIAAALESLKKRICILAVVDSLKHLQKGGRISAAVAIAGGALGIKPVIGVADAAGTVKMKGKGRGRPGALVTLFKKIDEMGGVDPDYGYRVLYSNDKAVATPINHYLRDNLHLSGGHYAQIGPAIGTHIGANAAGVVFVRAEMPDEAE